MYRNLPVSCVRNVEISLKYRRDILHTPMGTSKPFFFFNKHILEMKVSEIYLNNETYSKEMY
jgi:hypothetical protein